MTNQTKLTGIQKLEENAMKVYVRNMEFESSIHAVLKGMCDEAVEKSILTSDVQRYVQFMYKGEGGSFPYRFDIYIKPVFTFDEEPAIIASVIFDSSMERDLFTVKASMYTNMDGLDRYDGACLDCQEESVGINELFDADGTFIHKSASYVINRAMKKLSFSANLTDLIDLYSEIN